MTYPEGDMIARNLVQTPRFDESGRTDGWEIHRNVSGKLQLVAPIVEPRSWTNGAYTMVSTDTSRGVFRVPVPVDALERGLIVDFTGNPGAPADSVGTPYKVGLVPKMNYPKYPDTPSEEAFTKWLGTGAGSPPWTFTEMPSVATGSLGRSQLTIAPLPAGWSFVVSSNGTYKREHAVGAWLVFEVPTALQSLAILQLRADYADTAVTGYFDGDTEDTAEAAYAWTAGAYPSTSEARGVGLESEPEGPGEDTDPEPDTGPEGLWEIDEHPLAKTLARYVGRGDDPEAVSVASMQLHVVQTFIQGYTRGRGFSETGIPDRPLIAVLLSAAARLAANPEQITYYQLGDYSERPAVLEGWTLPEQAVLHRYRRRAA